MIKKILIATDSFKDSLSSQNVGEALKKGLTAFGDFVVDVIPLSDGGEGSIDSLISYLHGEKIELIAKDPLFRDISTSYFVTNTMAVIEMARISGLQLLSFNERNPMDTTTFGTGQLIKDALDRGYRNFLITIGGSATCDGGIGMAAALGYKFFDFQGNELLPIGRNLPKIAKIDSSRVDKRIFDSTFAAACDVDNPLYGKNGASFVYSAQKGANQDEILYLDKGLKNLSSMIKEHLKKDVSLIKGAGAAGGLGGGLLAFLNAELQRGIDLFLNMINFDEKVQNYDLVITGEGRIDSQTMNGKVVSGVIRLSKKYFKKVILVAADIDESAYQLYEHGADLILSIQQRPISLNESIKNAKKLLRLTGERIAKIITFSM